MKHTILPLAAACGFLLSFTPAGVAAPQDYQATGPIISMTDTTITIKYHGKEDWEFSKDAALKPASGAELKVGDKVTVHYTMAAKSIEANMPVSKEHKAPQDKPKAAAGIPGRDGRAERQSGGEAVRRREAAASTEVGIDGPRQFLLWIG